MDYHNFGYVVDSCPINLTEQRAAASRLKCGVDKFGNSQYLCVPNFTNTAIVEYCYNGTVGLHKKGSCLVVNNDGIVDIVSCHSFTEGCTTDFFKSSDLYQYPACHQIDTEARCFSADPTCQKTDPEITRNVSFVTSNTISSEFTTTLNYTNSTKNTEYGQISAVAIAFISIAFILVILGILFIGYRCLRSRKKKRKQKETVASGKDPFVLEENVKLRDIERDDEEKFRIEPEHNREGISGNVMRASIDEFSDENNESNYEEEPLIHKEDDVGLRKVEGNNTELEQIQNPTQMAMKALKKSICLIKEVTYVSESKVNKEEKGDNAKRGSTDEDVQQLLISEEGDDVALKEMQSINSVEDGLSMTEENLTEDTYSYDIYPTSKEIYQFSTLTDDEVFVLFCFLCSDSGPPDFTDTEWLDMLNKIRETVYVTKRVYRKEDPVTRKEAQQTLDRLKSRDFLWEDQDKIKEDIKDETMYKIASINCDISFHYSSYDTASVYLRSERYSRKPGEKCVISRGCDDLLIRRLQMNILTHVTMEDTDMYDKIYQTLNVPKAISQGNHSEREKFLSDQKQEGEAVHYRGRSQDSVHHVTWLWRYGRPDVVRSCIGLHPHLDIYIIDNKAYSKPTEYHKYSSDVRCLLYGLLLVDEYTVNISDDSYKTTLNKIRYRYFKEDAMSKDINTVDLLKGILQREDNTIMFTSEDIRHDVMYAFVTECLVGDSDLKFFLTTASGQVISEYCRLWNYKRSEEERCIYLPYYSRDMENLFLNKLQLDIIAHCSVLDKKICDTIIRRLSVPREILMWDKAARKRYVQYAKRGTQTVHHARGMIVGCAGAGKPTLLKRLLRCSEEEIRNVKSTEGLEVHEEIFQICDETKTLKVKPKKEDCDTFNKNKPEYEGNVSKESTTKSLSFFDFGGQCAYYACHQIYLTRRAFYVVVVDASKPLDKMVDKEVCDQADTAFADWTYNGYFLFWLKSIHTYCRQPNYKDKGVDVIIVATHWDESIHETKRVFLEALHQALPPECNLGQYIKQDRCFCIQFPLEHLTDLEHLLVDTATDKKWEENIPHEWTFLNDEILSTKRDQRIIPLDHVLQEMPIDRYSKERNTNDMLRYYHDAGKVLHFNESGLKEYVIIDVQWFVNAFKTIITDKNHVEGIIASGKDWQEYYSTGHLKDSLLSAIWKREDENFLKSVRKENVSEEIVPSKDARFLSHHKETLLLYMQRLGLISIGETSHYIPCMNKKNFGEKQKDIIKTSSSRSSVFVFFFDFLPYFLFYRLVVKLMEIESWTVLKSSNISCLYKNAAMFTHQNHNIAVAVTQTTIQIQICHPDEGCKIVKDVTLSVRKGIQNIMKEITGTFHKHLTYRMGYTCDKEEEQILGREITDSFIEEVDLPKGNKKICPQHQVENRHHINPDYLSAFWR